MSSYNKINTVRGNCCEVPHHACHILPLVRFIKKLPYSDKFWRGENLAQLAQFA